MPKQTTTHQPIPHGQAGVVVSAAGLGKALPKPEAMRNPTLLAMARGRECLLQFPGVAYHDISTVVACHSNLMRHGKAKGRKADDQYSVWGCATCHELLDQSRFSADRKEAIFMAALDRQREAWLEVSTNMLEERKTREAALWAIEKLTDSAAPQSGSYGFYEL